MIVKILYQKEEVVYENVEHFYQNTNSGQICMTINGKKIWKISDDVQCINIGE